MCIRDRYMGKSSQRKRSSAPEREAPQKEGPPLDKKVEEKFILVSHLTDNLTKDALHEIFSHFGKLKAVEYPVHEKGKLLKGCSQIIYETVKEAEDAVIYMNGGQIDGNELKCELKAKEPPKTSAEKTTKEAAGDQKKKPKETKEAKETKETKRGRNRSRSRSRNRRRRRGSSSESSPSSSSSQSSRRSSSSD
eukprot:TRINITY_DN954_c0_g2_i3.p1 TRINITY_DN954_c0_g2~~TRINITY_DN954_c0_g2_i3.p1  ORF type:complete len:213 (+),score=65.56 TRINITY_DN954_c0_g2_i3:61-639(+)